MLVSRHASSQDGVHILNISYLFLIFLTDSQYFLPVPSISYRLSILSICYRFLVFLSFPTFIPNSYRISYRISVFLLQAQYFSRILSISYIFFVFLPDFDISYLTDSQYFLQVPNISYRLFEQLHRVCSRMPGRCPARRGLYARLVPCAPGHG